jgi:hypothetical protein
VSLGRGADDREPEPRAGLLVPASPEAAESLVRIVKGGSGPFVGNAQAGNAVGLLGGKDDPAACRPVQLGVLNQVRERALQGRAVAADRDRIEPACL